MSLMTWFDVPIIRLHAHHASGSLSSVFVFKVSAWVIGQAVPPGTPRMILDRIESVVLVTIFSMLAIQLLIITGRQIWKKIKTAPNAEAIDGTE
jgi:hypothetical protein